MYTPPWGGIFKKYQRTPITPITVGKKQKTVSSCLRSSPFQMDCWYAVSDINFHFVLLPFRISEQVIYKWNVSFMKLLAPRTDTAIPIM